MVLEGKLALNSGLQVNGQEIWRTTTAVSHRPQYMILSTELIGWGGDPAQSAFPDCVIFDYVRVYKNGDTLSCPHFSPQIIKNLQSIIRRREKKKPQLHPVGPALATRPNVPLAPARFQKKGHTLASLFSKTNSDSVPQ